MVVTTVHVGVVYLDHHWKIKWDRSITGKLNLHTTASNTTLLCVENLVFDIRGDKHSTCTQHPCGDCNPLDMWYWMSGITDYGGLVLYCNEPKNKGGLQLYHFPSYFCDDNF